MNYNHKYFHPVHNVSQDSGLCASPYDLHYRTRGETVQPPPPLPPKKKSLSPSPMTNIFQPSMMVRTSSNSSGINSGAWRQQQRHRVEAQRNSILSSDDEDEELRFPRPPSFQRLSNDNVMNEPFPPELDFAQVVGHSQFNASQPPPPPPRDPRRKLYLSPAASPGCSRPVSYSFEKPDVVQKVPSIYVEPNPVVVRSRPIMRDQRQGRAASASSYFSQSVPDLVRPMEYWKCPPPPYVPTYDPYLLPPPPPRPPRPNLKKKLSDSSSRGRDSAIGPSPAMMNGKSSPSSSSVTSSRDSGFPPQALSAVHETQNGFHDVDDVDEEEEVEVIHCEDDSITTTESHSPPRTDENHPGFSSKARRSLFRAAINEIEDVFNQMSKDTDLLDRAERRDLPTAHQELIAQSRLEDTTSLNTSTEMIFSDMDNFMNWNTSSSFENIPEQRQRTPARRRSGAPDKVNDDMVVRLCRDNNKTPGSNDPGVKCNQSYLILSPAMTPASSQALLATKEDPDEPDVHFDDAHYRSIRDLQGRANNDPEPPFGIPKDKFPSRSSSKDYLHAVPDLNRYRSTFNPMKNPDTVLDDLAFRALRKDDNYNDPDNLGVVKDPNHHLVTPSSCWKHKMEAKLNERSESCNNKFPAVFYPKRSKKLLKVLADDIAGVIRKSSATPNGGKEAKVVTYEDLIKDPEVMQSMKKSLGIEEENDKKDENDEIVDGRPRWAGKTLYELLKNGHDDKTDDKTEEEEEAEQSCPPLEQILTVQHCVLEHEQQDQIPPPPPLGFGNDPKKSSNEFLVSSLLPPSEPSSSLRQQERSDSNLSSEDDPTEIPPQKASSEEEEVEGNVQAWFLEHPAFVTACYCLALLHQMGGLDFMSLLGMVLAMISMVSMFFL